MPKESTTVGHTGKDFDCTVLGDVFTDVIIRVNGDYRHFFARARKLKKWLV